MTKQKTIEHGDKPEHTRITGRFDQYRSSYWAAAVAALSLRYAFKDHARQSWENQKGFFKSHSYAAGGGTIMQLTVAFYAWRTWKDMRNIFAEPLAWEFNKGANDVTFNDFRHSKNTIIRDTVKRYIKYNARRSLVNASWFVPFIFHPLVKNSKSNGGKGLHWETGGNFGMWSNGMYLFSDVMSRRITPFEALQSTIDRKVNHASSASDEITADDLLNIYEHAAEGTSHLFSLQRGTYQWDRSMLEFERIAALMNKTYHNEVNDENANFTFPKLIYLIGHGLIDPDKPRATHAFIDVANRFGMAEVKKMQQQLGEGASLESIEQHYDISPMRELPDKDKSPARPEQKFATPDLQRTSFQERQMKKKATEGLSIAEREEQRRGSGLIEGITL